MGETLQRRLRSKRVGGPARQALLNLMVAAAHLRERTDRLFADYGVTDGQYNVLRILRGGPPEGYPRCDIAVRMIDRAPDVTRLVDRLEEQGLVRRTRSAADRRLSLASITRKGLALLERMDDAVEEAEHALAERLSAADCQELSRLCEQIYAAETP